MKPIVRALIAIITTWFRSRLSLQFEIVALRHQLTVYQRSARRPASDQPTRSFGLGCRGTGPGGARSSSSSDPPP
jgi:hypothetical protein